MINSHDVHALDVLSGWCYCQPTGLSSVYISLFPPLSKSMVLIGYPSWYNVGPSCCIVRQQSLEYERCARILKTVMSGWLTKEAQETCISTCIDVKKMITHDLRRTTQL